MNNEQPQKLRRYDRRGPESKKRYKGESGQSLVELTFGMIILLVLLMGLLDLGRLFYTLVALRNAAGEGALYGSLNPDCRTSSDGAACADPDNIVYRATHESSSGLVNWGTATVNIDRPQNASIGDPITVTVTYTYIILTPFINVVVGGSEFPLRVSATQNIFGDVP
jgi:Flp pilus assembly protein TadG